MISLLLRGSEKGIQSPLHRVDECALKWVKLFAQVINEIQKFLIAPTYRIRTSGLPHQAKDIVLWKDTNIIPLMQMGNFQGMFSN